MHLCHASICKIIMGLTSKHERDTLRDIQAYWVGSTQGNDNYTPYGESINKASYRVPQYNYSKSTKVYFSIEFCDHRE